MKKLLIVIALIGIVFISGCTGSTEDITDTGIEQEVDSPMPRDTRVGEENQIVGYTYYESSCMKDDNCLTVYCRDTPESKYCMNTIHVATKVECEAFGGMITEKDYDICGCVIGICASK